jgi:hypothetical protein
MSISKLACGPMSKEVVEAVFRYSHKFKQPLMLICSRNQVNAKNGYVFTTKEYVEYVAKMRRKYRKAKIMICRDHCGPGFGLEPEYNLDATRETIRNDLENGFDLIHIDLCHMKVSHEEKLRHTQELMKFAIGIKSDVMFEIGTDENIGVTETDVDKIVSDVKTCQQVANPLFYVVQTGSLVREIHNTSNFKVYHTGIIHYELKTLNVKLKEHNADYLSTEDINWRKGVVDAVNIAPQLGVVQTNYVLSQALIYGIDTRKFVSEVMNGDRWRKWVDQSRIAVVRGFNVDWFSTNPQWMLFTLIAGHYHFNGSTYQELVEKLAKKINIKENIVNEISKVIEHYLFALG